MDREKKLSIIAKRNGLVEMRSDIYDMSKYYYDKRRDKVYRVDGFEEGIRFERAEDWIERHIREMNGIERKE